MHKIAIASSVAGVLFILSASGFPEIGNWRKVQNDRSPCVKSATQRIKGSSSVLFLPKLHVNIPDHVVSKIVAHVQILNFSILAQLFEYVFVEILEVLLKLTGIRLLDVPVLIHAAVKTSIR